MSKSVKAGLIGAAAAAVLSLLGLIPCVGCVTAILGLLVYAGAGVLAAYWLDPPRMAGAGAGAGAIAGAIASLVGGIVSMIANGVRFAISPQAADVMSQMPPEALRAFQDAGIDPNMFATAGWVWGVSVLCCFVGLFIGAGLGAAGGAIMASAKSD